MIKPHYLKRPGELAAALRHIDSAELARQALLTPSAVRVAGLRVGHERQRIDAASWTALIEWARERGVERAVNALFDGEPVNRTEGRAATHVAARGNPLGSPKLESVTAAEAGQRQQGLALLERWRDAGIDQLIHVGIGGSDLGPRLVCDVLPPIGGFEVRFLSNVDAHAAHRAIAGIDAERCAFVVVSKSFGTAETLANAAWLRDRLGDRPTVAVTARPEAVSAAGFVEAEILSFDEGIGGRYSLWSAVGLVIAAHAGPAAQAALLAGAAEMDAHVASAKLGDNIALHHALVAVLNRIGFDWTCQVVAAYDSRLSLLPDYLQQLVMESLGKSVTIDGAPLSCATAPMLFGGVGTDLQHSFMQALHQGGIVAPVDFIAAIDPGINEADRHRSLLAQMFAQADALTAGLDDPEPHRRHGGGRPSSLLLLERLDAAGLGALLAFYEHSVYLQACLLGINPFDQFGVELGKSIAQRIEPALKSGAAAVDLDPISRRHIGWLSDPG